jgi:Uma2 family endonuclease
MTAALEIPAHMSAQEFLAWAAPGAGRWQLVDGEPQAMAPANRTQGALQNELGALLRNHFLDRSTGCFAIIEPGVVPRVRAAENVRVPDIGVTCTGYDAEESTLANPVLLVEILSPSNRAETWANVWACTTIPTVREILILRTATIGADLLRRGSDGTWPAQPEEITDGDLVLESVGFRCGLADLYRTTLLAR